MQFDISGNPDYGDLTVALAPGETIQIEGGAMSRMSAHLSMQSRILGGFFQGMVRKVFGGESLFIGEYTAVDSPGYVSLSPSIPGCVLHREMQGDTFILTGGAFLACTPGLEIKPRFGGLKALFSGEKAFVLEVSGEGDLFYNGYGGVVEKQVDGEFIVDTGHVVAWEPSLTYSIGGMGGLKQTLFSGEGLVMRFKGQGTVWVQTRHMGALSGWLRKYC